MIEGELIRLRPWHEEDIPTIMALRNDVALQAKLLARARGSDQSQVRKWLEERSSEAGSLLFIVAERSSDEAVGYLQFTGIDPLDRNADLGICLATAAQSKGFGTEALKLGIVHLRNHLDVRKISLRVRADNPAAIRCYTAIGFEKCGELKDHAFFDANWQTVLLMELFLNAAAGKCA